MINIIDCVTFEGKNLTKAKKAYVKPMCQVCRVQFFAPQYEKEEPIKDSFLKAGLTLTGSNFLKDITNT